MTDRSKPPIHRFLKPAQFLVLAGLAVLLWHTFDGAEAARLLLVADLRWAFAAAIILTLQTLLSATRWQLTAGRLGIVFSLSAAVREYYLAQFVNLSLPGGVIGDAGRAYRSRQGKGLLLAGQAVVFERIAGQIGLLAVFLAGLTLQVLSPGGFDWPGWLAAPVMGMLAALIAGFCLVTLGFHVFRHHAQPLRRLGQRFLYAVLHRDVAMKQACLSLLTALCNVVAFALCAVALGVDLAVLDILTIVPLILLGMLLPIGVGGWGVREGAAALLFPVMGAASSAGLATSVAFGLVIVISMLAGLALSWALGPPKHQIVNTQQGKL